MVLLSEISKIAIDSILGKHFSDVLLKRSNRILTLASLNSSTEVYINVIPITLIHCSYFIYFSLLCYIFYYYYYIYFLLLVYYFHYILFTKKFDEELRDYLKYKLMAFPLSIFNELGMRKSQKPLMYKVFNHTDINVELKNYICVVNGGYLLHRVIWPSNQT